MIKYMLVENAITAETESCYAVVSSPGTKKLDDIITHMINEGSGLTRPQAMAYFERLTQSVIHFANQGYSIATPLFRTRPTICGTFNSKEDKFDPKRHQIKIRGMEGQRLREMPIKITKIVKITDSKQSPVLYTFTDICSETKNKTITVGGIGMLSGKRLRIDTKDPRLGLFFVPTDAPEDKIRVNIYSYNKPSEIHFQIPELAAGEYNLIVQTLSRNGKDILSGKLKESLKIS
ncbi:MAG: hypothetical protein BGO29_04080 [Bacteroidales bacterium 36-12]|jgi:hypothetical protein|nr:MAG: hypothetical protein BGO29_04080 [Bacteroidales bacterium 36-12]